MRTILFASGVLWTAASSTASAMTGCSGTFSAAPPEGGLDAGEGGEGGGPSADASALDGGASGKDDASTSWCSGRTELFCEDFDEQADVGAFLPTWTTHQQNSGSFFFDTGTAVPSPPNALRATGTSGAQVLVVREFPKLPDHEKKLLLGFELRIDQSENIGKLSGAGLAAIAYGKDLTDGYVAMAIGSGPVLEAAWSAPSDAGSTTGAGLPFEAAGGTFPAPQTWPGRYTLQIDYATMPPCVQIFQGTTALLAKCLSLPPSLAVPPVGLSIALGDYSAGFDNTGTVDVEFDNVVFDAVY